MQKYIFPFKILLLQSIAILSFTVSIDLYAQEIMPRCHIASSWRTVDVFNETEVREAVPHALATSGKTVFAAGTANGEAGGWIVRRSLDQGGTWTTVDRFQHPEFRPESAGGIAVDAKTRHIYAAGALSEISGNPAGWIVRKSTDNGSTWNTVDEVIGAYGARKIAVDRRGIIYVVGSWDGAGGFLRRSIDGGSTWRTVAYSSTRLKGYSVITAPNGRVFVGAIDSEHGWHILTSANGLSAWEEVDYLPGLGYGSPGDAHITKDGRILFTGIMPTYGGLVRTSRLSNFRKWGNLFVLKDHRFNASTSTRDGRVFVTGVAPYAADDRFNLYTTWVSTTEGRFAVHDQFRQNSQVFGSPIDHTFGAAAVNKFGDVFTAQFWNPEVGSPSGNWIVRKLPCL